MCEARFALSSIAKPGAIAPTPASRQGRWFPLAGGNSLSSYAGWPAACFDDHLNSLPSIHMRCGMTASFRATAILALRSPLRFATLRPQALSDDPFCYTGEQHIGRLVEVAPPAEVGWAEHVRSPQVLQTSTSCAKGGFRAIGFRVVGSIDVLRSRNRHQPAYGPLQFGNEDSERHSALMRLALAPCNRAQCIAAKASTTGRLLTPIMPIPG
jgi:hypothetical protein